MRIASLRPDDQAEFLAIVNAEIRPDRANTHAWEDFPLILGEDNLQWQLVAHADDGRLAGGIACLIREFQTSWGVIPVAGIGSVVTRPEFRGRGLSRSLQAELIRLLAGKNIPLGVLWSDRPEIYAGRGFLPAGWEIHVQLPAVAWAAELPAFLQGREFQAADTEAVAELYQLHPYHTRRLPSDSFKLYNMPGTKGLVAVDTAGQVRAALFCGKGADFPDYVAEWSGPVDLVLCLLQRVLAEGLAHHLLVCAGGEAILEPLGRLGATWFTQASGLWKVICPDELAARCRELAGELPENVEDPVSWLGDVDPAGRPRPGLIDMAVWGFDSV